jgi:oxalate decarboxylase
MTEISRRSMIAAAGGAMMASPALAQTAAPLPQRG